MLLASNMKVLVVNFRQNINFIGVMCGCLHYLSKNTRNYIQYFLTLVLFTFCTCCILRCLVCIVSCLVCIVVVVLCVLL